MAEPALPVLSVLIPVRNEGLNVSIMVRILHATMDLPYEVVIVHDTPEDETVPVAKALAGRFPVRLVLNDLGRGVANAIRAGARASKGEYVLIFAADEVGPVLAIEDMLALMREGCDVVSCTRYAWGGRRLGGSLAGKTLSWTANFLFRLLTRCPFTDLSTGIKMFRREMLAGFDFQSAAVGWAVAFEIAIKVQLLGLKLGEVPIISIDRLYGGKSSFRVGPWVKEYSRWFWWGLKSYWGGGRAKASKDIKVRVPSCTAPG